MKFTDDERHDLARRLSDTYCKWLEEQGLQFQAVGCGLSQNTAAIVLLTLPGPRPMAGSDKPHPKMMELSHKLCEMAIRQSDNLDRRLTSLRD